MISGACNTIALAREFYQVTIDDIFIISNLIGEHIFLRSKLNHGNLCRTACMALLTAYQFTRVNSVGLSWVILHNIIIT